MNRKKIEDLIIEKVKRKMNVICLQTITEIRQKLLSGNPIKTRSGLLRRRISFIPAKIVGDFLISKIGFGAKYAKVHINKAGTVTTIKPKSRKNLAIPLPPALTPAGVLRKPASFYTDTFVRKGIIFQKLKRKIIPLFVLKKSVTIRVRITFDIIKNILKQKLKKVA